MALAFNSRPIASVHDGEDREFCMSDSMTSAVLTAESAQNYLRAVIDPEIYQNIVDLGLVYGVEVQADQSVDVTMTLTTPHCPMGPQIIENVEKVLLSHGASDVRVHI